MFECNVASMLDGCTIGKRITEGHAKFDNVGSRLCCCQYQFNAACSRWVTAHEVGDEDTPSLAFRLLEGMGNPRGWCCSGERSHTLIGSLHGCLLNYAMILPV